MLDPITLTATVVSLTARCVQTVKALSELKDKISNARLTVSSVCTEATIISASLSQIQILLLQDQSRVESKLRARPELISTFDTALTGCVVVFDVLDNEIRKRYGPAATSAGDAGFFFRLKVLWHESTMQDLLTQLRGLQGALTFLLTLIGTNNMTDLARKIQQNTMVVDKLAQQTRLLRSNSVASKSPDSVFDITFDTQSVYQRDDFSYTATTRFAFDNDVLRSPVYRRARVSDARNSTGPSPAPPDPNRLSATDMLRDDAPVLDIPELQGSHPGSDDNPSQNLERPHSSSTSKDAITQSEVYQELLAKYSKVKRYYFDREAQVTMLERIFFFDDRLSRTLTNKSVSDLATELSKTNLELVGQGLVTSFITSEAAYLDLLKAIEYLYRQALVFADPPLLHSIPSDKSILEFAQENFGFARQLHNVNQLTLLHSLTDMSYSNGDTPIVRLVRSLNDWLDKASNYYKAYAARLPEIDHAIREASSSPLNAEFANLLLRNQESPQAKKLGYHDLLKQPVEQVTSYVNKLADFLPSYSSTELTVQERAKISNLFNRLKSLQSHMQHDFTESSDKLRQQVMKTEIQNMIGPARLNLTAFPDDSRIVFHASVEDESTPELPVNLVLCILEYQSSTEQTARTPILYRDNAKQTNSSDYTVIDTVLGCGNNTTNDSPSRYPFWLLCIDDNNRKLMDLSAASEAVRDSCVKELLNKEITPATPSLVENDTISNGTTL